ncbi:MAG: DUF2189 domain-containing protein [Thiobacillaceae bacterium]
MSMPSASNQPQTPPEEMPFVAPCRTLQPSAPLRWLRLGWADLIRAPRLSLAYGLVLMLLSMTIGALTLRFGTLALYIGLATGFVFVGPVLAIGLYSISRQLGEQRHPVLGYCVREGKDHLRELMVLGLILLVVLLVWARAAATMYIFFPEQANPGWRDMLPFLGIGSLVGALFASIVFAASAFSLPMILDRKVDSITAVVTSVNAVLRNKPAMFVWAGLIGICVLLGFATAFLGFAVLLPLIGHATWHAYNETIDASAWPKNEQVAGGSPV